MSDDTGTDWAALADVLEDWPYGQPRVTKQEAELAAVGLRRLAQLEARLAAARASITSVEDDDPNDLIPALEEAAERTYEARAAAVLGSGEQPAPPTRRPLPPVNPGQRMPGGPTPQP